MRHPFQCLQACYIPGPSRGWIVLAAARSQINSFALYDGTLLPTWDISTSKGITDALSHSMQSVERCEDNPPPEKRQKTICDPMEGRWGAAVLTMTATRNHRNVVVVTGEDKCIRVFKLEENGRLSLLSERCMPKRPCAIAITPDDSTILCADKFGDVYSIPLHPSPQPTEVVSEGIKAGPGRTQTPSTSKKFVPAANNLTVHTARNLKALKNQLRATNQPSEKTAPDFEHQLLLGHVSMLTDIAFVTLDTSTSPHGKPCSYILTADRDEHIRVSRGPPQAHVIETFCLGHKEFVSKLCIPHWLPRTLISGGGDGFLCVWSWASGLALQKVDMRLSVDEYLNSCSRSGRKNFVGQAKPKLEGLTGGPGSSEISSEDKRENPEENTQRDGKAHEAAHSHKLTVSGIWSISQTELNRDMEGEVEGGDILVACEGISAIFVFTLSMDSMLTYRDFIPLKGNVLDVATFGGEPFVIVSVDTLHQQNSTSTVSDPPSQEVALLQLLSRSSGGSWSDDIDAGKIETLNQQGSFEIKVGLGDSQSQVLRDLLYKYQSLRKQEYEEE
ncbi:hypothetical protein FGG08_001606 [Glutinoglossum americanum]|uniref:Transfer RNA methyltransferase 82 n=1 Tax=Glutinoglossum americanum TaxID=1670608 RepID=A0A9P8I1Q7_9PEZI|nr:hypothetical protein FGG08_001606 [Glutinoglossum americanum]